MPRLRIHWLPSLLMPLLFAGCGGDELLNRGDLPAATGGIRADTGGVGGGAGLAGGGVGGSAGGSAPGTGGGAGESPGRVIDDFEDGDTRSVDGATWFSYDDRANGGGSTVTIPAVDGVAAATGEGFESLHSLLVEYAFDQGTLTYEPFVGFGVNLSPAGGITDISGYQGLSYTYRGGAHEVRIETTDVLDYNYHAIQIPASASWRTLTLPFEDLAQGNWGTVVPFEPAHAISVTWHVRGATGVTANLQVDDVKLLIDAGVVRVPDLVIREPQPPADVVLDTVAIETPLQARAVAGLSRGYNITNWLEQGPFTDFGAYDEAFVGRLAAAGFRSLRLPIDLDQFVEQRTVDGDTVTLTVSDDLFTVLDSFEQWTATHGLGFTIDYHQYDRSLDFADPATLAEMVELWSLVAEHFASNPREDLFFERLNEPELSVPAAAPPTAAQWTSLAEHAIAAIRAHDTTHSILFGDVEWYGISPLTRRTPFADPNVIYVFHFYDPFIFTHQGASWAEMGSTHGIPYPYEPARWSEYSRDFGFSELNPSWQLGQLQTYFQNGTKAAMRNRIAQAKSWGITHQVPVLCNEFGAYDAVSLKEDRVRYYTDLIDVFTELEIPWQVWFMLMDPATGDVDPDYRAAFDLDG